MEFDLRTYRREELNTRLFDILKRYKKVSGVPTLLALLDEENAELVPSTVANRGAYLKRYLDRLIAGGATFIKETRQDNRVGYNFKSAKVSLKKAH